MFLKTEQASGSVPTLLHLSLARFVGFFATLLQEAAFTVFFLHLATFVCEIPLVNNFVYKLSFNAHQNLTEFQIRFNILRFCYLSIFAAKGMKFGTLLGFKSARPGGHVTLPEGPFMPTKFPCHMFAMPKAVT